MIITKKDVFTVANAITIMGLILVVLGSTRLNTQTGLFLVVLGRAFDLIDGPVARFTHTSKFSAILDPTVDKLALLSIVVALFYFSLAPGLIVSYVVVYNLLITALSLKAFRAGKSDHALIPGKINLFFQNISLISFVASSVFPEAASTANIIGIVSIVASLPFALFAIKSYSELAFYKA